MPEFDELKEKLKEIAEILKEYPEQLQPKVFDVLLESLNISIDDNEKLEDEENSEVTDDSSVSDETNNNTENNQPHTTKQPRRKSTSKESYKISMNLDLSGAGVKQSFSDFYNEKNPSSNIEFNAVAVYYLKKIMELENVAIEDIYTCYINVRRRVPNAFKQSLIDTSRRYGYVQIDNGTYSLPIPGINFVEYDLPKVKNK